VEACREANGFKYPEPEKPFPKMYPKKVKIADWSKKREVMDRLTPYNWLFIQNAVLKIKGEEKTYTIPRRCMHCQNPPCADLCPWGAARKSKNGLTRIESGLCLGGSKCKSVCPWHIPERQTGVGLYLDILPSLAACIEACPEGVQKIGPRDEIIKEAHAIAKRIKGYIYGEEQNGGTNTIYISPVPFENLNKAIEKGPGRPHLDPVL